MSQPRVKRTLEIETTDQLAAVFGNFDENAKLIEKETGTVIRAEGTSIIVEGEADNVSIVLTLVEKLSAMIDRAESITHSRILYALDLIREDNADLIDDLSKDVVAFTNKGRQIKSKTVGQRRYVRAIRDNDVTFAIGPAGTGKTYLAVAMAVVAFKNKDVSKIVLTRPAVEAGEKLGFLPGDLQNKVDPYLRPLYDALYDFFGVDAYRQHAERGAIEIAPLAYMRGRTLSDAFIILDEAQNCTIEQMKMFLTRFGEGSKVVVTGDVTQIDLPKEKKSGLVHAVEVLNGIEKIEIVNLTAKDVVRHQIVARIILAYEKAEKRRERQRAIHDK